MATMRAIEQGFLLVRSTEGGISMATDPWGRILAWLDTNRPGVHLLVANVSTARVTTVYSRVGDLFSWLCATGFGLTMVLLVIRVSQKNGIRRLY